ncbi:MAG: hypothetical protein II296_07375, partial [Bacteroidaceae bacterium]|nr:hypothetical protein [Bacteroidaceae bacterium]
MHKIKTILTLLLLLALHIQLPAQRTSVKDMRNRVKRLQQQIKEKESILQTSEKDIKSKINSLQLLTSQADEQKALIDLLSKELKAIDAEIKLLDGEITAGEAKVEKSKKEYAAALSRARRYGTLQDKLLFIISADDFNKMLHRYRYTREYMNAHRKQAEQLKENIRSLQAKRAEADSVRSQKNLSLEEQKQEQTKLKTLEDKQRTLLAELKRENKAVKNELDRRRKELNGLNAAIDKAITEELEARRKAEEERKRAQAKKTPSKKEKTSKKETTSAVTTKEEPSSKAKEPPTHSAEAIKKQSGSFLQNKGRLPVPVTGPYRMINSYGLQRATTGKGNVSIDLGGITFACKSGAKARAIFQGEVMGVYGDNEFVFLLVKHGQRIRQISDRILAAAGVTPRIVLSSRNYEMLRRLAAEGMGYTL